MFNDLYYVQETELAKHIKLTVVSTGIQCDLATKIVSDLTTVTVAELGLESSQVNAIRTALCVIV